MEAFGRPFPDLDGLSFRVADPVLPRPEPLVSLALEDLVQAAGGAGEDLDDQIRRALDVLLLDDRGTGANRSRTHLSVGAKPLLDTVFGIAYNTNVRPKGRIVLDTSAVVAGLRSRQGASFELLSLLERGRFEIAVSVPLVFEYEDALVRHVESGLFTHEEVGDFLDYLCRIGHRQNIFFLWRPFLQDPKDDMILELAFAAGCESIVTHNQRDFSGAERLGVKVHTPKELLRLLKEPR